MGRLFIVVNDNVENRLRLKVAVEGKGAISRAVEEALVLWLKTKKEAKP